MSINPASSRMSSLIALFDIHTKFLHSALEGISHTDAHQRLGTKANHVSWLAGSIVHERFETAKALGYDRRPAAYELFKNNKGIQDDVTYPHLESFKNDWDSITPLLRDALLKVSDAKLDEKFEMMPGMSMSYYELLTFIHYREASIIGQIALWRRLLGYPAMRYM